MNKFMKMLGIKDKKPYREDGTIDFDEVFAKEPFEDDDDYPDEEFDEVYGGESRPSEKKRDSRVEKRPEKTGGSDDTGHARTDKSFDVDVRPERQDEYERDARPVNRDEYERDVRPARRDEYERDARPVNRDEYERDVRPANRDEYERDVRPTRRDEYERDARPVNRDEYDGDVRSAIRDEYDRDIRPAIRDDYDYDREPIREQVQVKRTDREPIREQVQVKRTDREPIREQINVKRSERESFREPVKVETYNREPARKSSEVSKTNSRASVNSSRSNRTERKTKTGMFGSSGKTKQSRDSRNAKKARDARSARDTRNTRDAKKASDTKKARNTRDTGRSRKNNRYKEPAFSKVSNFAANTSFAERAAVVGALVILVGVVVMITFYSGALGRVKKIKSFDEVGADFKAEAAVGLMGINAIRDAEKARLVAENPEEESEEEAAEEEKNVNIIMTLTSIKSDMKIKFIDSSTNKLVSNVPFAVSVENPDGTKVTYDDHDQDGIIYKNNLTSGVYQITPVELVGGSDKYNIPIATQSLTIKDKVEMKAVDVSNEIKKESEVNVAAEDTAVQETVESELKDTVDYIESTQTSGQENNEGNEDQEFETIDKSLIVDPTTSSKLQKLPADAVTTVGLPVMTASGRTTYTTTECGYTTCSTVESGQLAYNAIESGRTTCSTAESDRPEFSTAESGNTTFKTANAGRLSCTATSGQPAYSIMKLAATNADSEIVIIEGDTNTPAQTTQTTQPSNDEAEVIVVEQPDTTEEKKTESSNSESSTTQEPTISENGTDSGNSANTGNASQGTANTGDTSQGTSTGSNASQGTANTTTSQSASQEASTSEEPVIIEVNPDASSTASTSTTTTTTTPAQSTTGSTESEGIVVIEQAPSTDVSTTGKTTTSEETVTIQEGTTTTAGVEFSTKDLEPTITEETEKEKETKKLEFLSNKVSVEVGKEFKIEPIDTELKVTYSTADKKIATISKDGTIKGVAAGETTITVKCDGYENAEIAVTVTKDTTPLKDKDGNIIYVKENGKYREATAEDLKKEGVVFYVDKAKSLKYTGWQTIDGKTYYYDKNGNYVTGEQVIQGAKYVFDDKGVLTKSSGTLGIDVSKWNGNIDWSKVKKSNVSYAIIRCGYRGSSQGALIEDPQFRTNIQGALDAGLKVGVYFFTQAVNEVEAVEEASMVIELIKGYNITLPVYLDVEGSNGRGDSVSASQRTANIKAFCGTLQSAGYRPGIYSNKTWYTTKMNIASLTNYHIWLAQYAASVTYTTSRYDMWQYTSKGKVSGISGNVDLDLLYNN